MKKILFALTIVLATWSGITFAEEIETTTTSETIEAPKINHRMRWTLQNRRNKKNLNTRNFKERYGKAGDREEKADRREDRRTSKGFGRRRAESNTKRDKTDWRTNVQRYSMRGEGQTRRKEGVTRSTRMEDRLKNRRVPYFQKRRYVENRVETDTAQ